MAKKKGTPHLDEWVRTFKGVGSKAASIGASTLQSMAPGISNTVSSTTESIRDSRNFINKAKSTMNQYTRALSTTRMNKNAMSILNSAYDDIRTGNYSLNQISDSSYDMIDEFDDNINNIKIDTSDPNSIAIGESKKNMAILGKAVTEGNVASIEGMKHMTTTLSNIQIKTSEATVNKLSNVMISGITQTTAHLAGINSRLDTINHNIVSLLDFQRNNVQQTNQAAVEFYSEASQMLNKMGALIAEMQDTQKPVEKERFNVSDGFNFKDYKKFVKKNIDNSALGMMMSMGSMMFSMTDMMGESPLEMFAPMLVEGLLPKHFKKSVKRLDKSFTSSIDSLLYRIGDLRNGNDPLKRFIGEVFGKEREKVNTARLGNFKKDAMSWNGIAQKTLVTVIPGYLARIESALNGKSENHYNMDTGMWMNADELKESFQKTSQNMAEMMMFSVREVFDEISKNVKLSENDEKLIGRYMNDFINKQLSSNGKTRKEDTQELAKKLRKKIGNTNTNDLLMSLLENTDDVIRERSKQMQNISGSPYEVLFNQYGSDTADLFKAINVLSNAKYVLKDGVYKKFEKGSEEYKKEMQKEEDAKYFNDKIKNAKNKFLFGEDDKPVGKIEALDLKLSKKLDSLGNLMYNAANGFDLGIPNRYGATGYYNDNGEWVDKKTHAAQIKRSIAKHTEEPKKKSKVKAASSVASNRNKNTTAGMSDNLQKEMDRVAEASFDDVINMTQDELEAEADKTRAVIEGNSEQGETSVSVLSKLVMGIQSHLLNPFIGGIFGKDGFFKKIFNKDNIQELGKKLFNSKDGMFKEVGLFIEDQMAKITYTFTGKAYTDSEGKKHGENKNSVFDHLANGYDFVFKNTMTHLFGEDYEKNETYQKIFSKLNFKGKRDAKREQRIINAREESIKKAATGYYDQKNGRYVTPEEHEAQIRKSYNRNQRKINNEASGKNEAKMDQAYDSVTESTAKAGETIENAAQNMAATMFGSTEDPKISSKISQNTTKETESKLKKSLPKTIASGIAGAAGGGLIAATGGAGLLGSLFLPGGPIGGALVGIGLSMASKSEGLKKFIFGEADDDGKKMGGLISNKTQEFIKKNMPLIVGGGALGLLKSIVFGSSGGLLGTLIGGPLAGAGLSIGIGLLKSNKTIQSILFGKDNEDGEKTGSILSKGMGTVGKILDKSGAFIKGGLKGLGIGAFTGLTLSKMGIIGSALSMGGPIGMGIAGLGIGIASQTTKFQDLLFGTKEFDEDGNFKGRAGDGLLTRVRNMLVLNVFEPIKDKINEKAIDFAFWAKDKIMYPFRAAFGPIADSLKGIKKNISDAIHDTFENVANTVGKALKTGVEKLFSPFTKLLGSIGKFGLNLVTNTLKLSLAPLTGGLKLLEFATAGKRRKAMRQERGSIFSNFGNILSNARSVTDQEDAEGKYGSGIFGRAKKFVGGIHNIREGIDAHKAAYQQELSEEGKNSFNWMNLKDEKKADKAKKKLIKNDQKTWSKINRERRLLNKEYNGQSNINFTEDEIKNIQKRFGKLGVNKEFLSTNEDIEMFLHNRDDWKEKYFHLDKDGNKVEGTAYMTKHGLKIVDSKETKSYQQYVMEKFDYIAKKATEIAARQELKNKQNLKLQDIKDINKRLSSMGISWKDLDIDPSQLVNKKDISRNDFLKFMDENDKEGGNASFSKYFKNFFSNDNSANIGETLQDIAEATKATAILNANDASVDMGMSNADITNSTGFKVSSKSMRGSKNWKKQKSKAERDAREAEESKNAQSGGTEYEKEEKAVIEGITDKDKDDNEEKKQGILSKIFGFGKKILGGITDSISDGSFWAKAGLGVVAGAAIAPEAKKFWDNTIGPTMESLWESHLSPMLKSAGESISDWWDANGTEIVANLTDNIVTNMPTIISNSAKIAGSAIETSIKLILNKAASAFPGDWVPFPDVATDRTKGIKNFGTDKERAEKYSEKNNVNIHYDEESDDYIALDKNLYVDADGNVQRVGNSNFLNSAGRELINFGLYKSNRKATKSVYKTSKAILTHIPGLAGKINKGLFAAGEGAINLGKKGVKGISKVAASSGLKSKVAGFADNATSKISNVYKSAKTGIGDFIENNIKKASKTTTEKMAKEAGDIKGIKKFFEMARTQLNNFAKKVEKYIPVSKFKEVVNKYIDDLTRALSKCDNKALKKIGEKILKKGGSGAVRTAGDATVVIGIAFAVYDGATGAMNAAELFGVADNEVDWKMRIVSAIMNIILGIGPVAIFDLILELGSMLLGVNPKQNFARMLYKAIGSEEKLDEATKKLELETAKYNAAHGSNLTTKEFSRMKSESNTKWNFFTMISKKKREAYDRKYGDINSYQVYDYQYNDYVNSGLSAKDYANKYTKKNKDAVSTNYGTGPKQKTKALGYGKSPWMNQSDGGWGNYPLGKFPDGTTSTMASGGCGPTALAMVATEQGHNATPLTIAKYAKANGYIKDGGATAPLFTTGAKKLGINAKQIDRTSIRSSLKRGDSIILSGKSDANGPYTEAGHIVKVSGLSDHDTAIVDDPMRGRIKVKMNDLASGMTGGWDYPSTGYGSGSRDINLRAAGYGYTYGTTFGNSILGTNVSSSSSSTSKNTNNKSSSYTGYLPSDVINAINRNTRNSVNPQNMYIPSEVRNQIAQNGGNTSLGISSSNDYSNSEYYDGSSFTTDNYTNTEEESGFSKIFKELCAIGYASVASLMGEDYATAKAKYLSGGSSSNSSPYTGTLTGSDNAEKIWNFFTGLGYSPAATAGIMGNLQQESGLNPAAIQGGGRGPAAGISQWENYNKKSGRWKLMSDYAKARGADWTDLQSQLEYMHNEMQDPSNTFWGSKSTMAKAGGTPTTYEAFMQSTNVDMATRQFEGAYTRAGKPMMANRLNYANNFYKLYANASVNYGLGSALNKGKSNRAIGYGPGWLQIVKAVKQAIAAKNVGYSQSRHITINVFDQQINVRTDCSGFVSACLNLYGSMSGIMNTTGLLRMTLPGFTKMKWPGWESLREGDIIVNNGHTEIFAGINNGQHYVYNCGSNSSCNNPNPTVSGHSSYTTVFRPNELGATGDYSATGTSDSYGSSVSLNPLDDIMSSFKSSISTFNDSLIDKAFGYGNGPAKFFTKTLNGFITSGYGNRKSSFGNEFHRGLDIGAKNGTSILSPIDGTVVSTGNDAAGYGNYAVVQDRDGNNHLFAHMNKPVGYGPGTPVFKNSIIGQVGSTGKSSGNHLHYEIRKSGNKYSTINPMSFNYDSDVSKNLNIAKSNLETGIGSGDKDLASNANVNKLNVALNTHNMEDKLDTLIEVMKTWAERDKDKEPTTPSINQTNNTTTISYGNGKPKTTKSTSTTNSKVDKTKEGLLGIHKLIASK